MKVKIIDTDEFQLIPENYQDKLWFKEFMITAKKTKVDDNMEIGFTYSDEREGHDNEAKGGGYANPEDIVDSHWSAGNGEIGANELKYLAIHSYKL